jgi:redox-regulated HSP33 family molecular chaperone
VSELHKFVFDGLPVRGMLVRLTDGWQELLRRRAGNTETGPYPMPVQRLLGEMSAAAVLLQGNIKFNGSVLLQIQSHGPVRLAVAEVQPDLAFRATANLKPDAVTDDAGFVELVSAGSAQGRCAITIHWTASLASIRIRAWSGWWTPRASRCPLWPTCCASTCTSPSSSTPRWCLRPMARWRRAC